MNTFRSSFPLFLTLFRLIFSALFLPCLFYFFLPLHNPWYNFACMFLFVVCAFTDYLDGYYARKWQVVSLKGKILDPLADKVLTLTSFLSLLAVQRIGLGWVLIFLVRETLVMGMREVALAHGCTIHVASVGKWKTACQMMLIGWLVLDFPFWWEIGGRYLLLIMASMLSIFSGIHYSKKCIQSLYPRRR